MVINFFTDKRLNLENSKSNKSTKSSKYKSKATIMIIIFSAVFTIASLTAASLLGILYYHKKRTKISSADLESGMASTNPESPSNPETQNSNIPATSSNSTSDDTPSVRYEHSGSIHRYSLIIVRTKCSKLFDFLIALSVYV